MLAAMFGLLNVNKPPGPTSHDVVARARRLLPRRTRVGHAGTLDPFAGGVLVLCVGAATRLADYVQAAPKRYRAEATFGAVSTTDDPEGEIVPRDVPTPPTARDLVALLPRFVGEIQQTPPAHSAVHVQGRRAYELARAGRDVTLPARTVRVYSLELLAYDWPRAVLDVRCASGTYVRSLVRDLGEALGVGAYCSGLTRSAVGEFHLEHAREPDALDPARDLLPGRLAVGHLPKVRLGEDDLALVANGRPVPLADVRSFAPAAAASPAAGSSPNGPPALPDGCEVALLGPDETLVAIATIKGEVLRPRKVFLAR